MTTATATRASRAERVLPPWAVASILGALAAALSFWSSWSISLWTDEAATLSAIRRSPQQLAELLGHIDAVHGAYYFFLQQWTAVLGTSPAVLRLPSALAVGVAAAGVYAVGRMLADDATGLVAAVVFAVLPRTTWMGTEARSFAFTAAFAVWATLLLVVALRRRRWWLWAGYAAVAGLAIIVNIFVALLLAAHLVTVLLSRGTRWGTRIAWAAAAVAAVLLASPMVAIAAAQKGQLGDIEFGIAAWLRGFAVNQWFLGATPTPVYATTSGPSAWSVAAVGLAVVCWTLMVWGVIVAARGPGVARRDESAGPSLMVVALPWILVPPILTGLYSAAVSPLYNPRYFTFATPAIALAVAAGLLALPRLWLRITAAAAVLILALPVYISQRQPDAKSGTDWNAAATYIGSHAHSGDGVYFTPLHEPTGAVVGPTTRSIEISYPSAFRRLVDITAERSPVEDSSLTGTSALLPDSAARLDAVDRLWVIRRDDYPDSLATSDASVLAANGFVLVSSWHGSIDSVQEYVHR